MPNRSIPKLQVIEGGLLPERELTLADALRMVQPSIKALPFVKVKKDAEPQWHPESHWNVRQSRNWNENHARGAQYAVAAVAAMRADGCNVLSNIFSAMIQANVDRIITARKEKRREPKRDTVMVGFLHQLGAMFEPQDGGEFAAYVDDTLKYAGDAIRALRDKRRPRDEALTLLEIHIHQLERIQERIRNGHRSAVTVKSP
jgi:hypothetical protein